MKNQTITVIDETIREGMQHRGIVFSREQREAILDFQEELGVDVCQAGYASAHITEMDNIKHLNHTVLQKGYKIRVAGMGRASIQDVDSLINTGIWDFHLHADLKCRTKQDNNRAWNRDRESESDSYIEKSFHKIGEAVDEIRKHFDYSTFTSTSNPRISIAVLDIGTSSSELLQLVSSFLINDLGIDILSLPDTSGIMSPDTFYDTVKEIALSTQKLSDFKKNQILKPVSQISVHCHNDLGMASANTLMGVFAGATVVELSALGIGERNGIGDIFTVCKILKDKGYNIRLKTDDIKLFRKYYQYVSNVCKAQTGEPLLNYNSPFFGDSVRTHVAGTHAGSGFGLFPQKEEYLLNVLCGRHLVKSYLESEEIPCLPEHISSITEDIKSKSAALGRRIEKEEVMGIVAKHNNA